jgi:hypothetical protein
VSRHPTYFPTWTSPALSLALSPSPFSYHQSTLSRPPVARVSSPRLSRSLSVRPNSLGRRDNRWISTPRVRAAWSTAVLDALHTSRMEPGAQTTRRNDHQWGTRVPRRLQGSVVDTRAAHNGAATDDANSERVSPITAHPSHFETKWFGLAGRGRPVWLLFNRVMWVWGKDNRQTQFAKAKSSGKLGRQHLSERQRSRLGKCAGLGNPSRYPRRPTFGLLVVNPTG